MLKIQYPSGLIIKAERNYGTGVACKVGKRGGIYAEYPSGARRYFRTMHECLAMTGGYGIRHNEEGEEEFIEPMSEEQIIKYFQGMSGRARKLKAWLRNYLATPDGDKNFKDIAQQVAAARIRNHKAMLRVLRRLIVSPLRVFLQFRQKKAEAKNEEDASSFLTYLEKISAKNLEQTKLAPHELASGMAYLFSYMIGHPPGLSELSYGYFARKFVSTLLLGASVGVTAGLSWALGSIIASTLIAPYLWKHFIRHAGRIAAEKITGEKIDRLTWDTGEGVFGVYDFFGGLDKLPEHVLDLIDQHPPKDKKFDPEVEEAIRKAGVNPKLVIKVLKQGYGPEDFKRFNPDTAHEIWESHYIKGLRILTDLVKSAFGGDVLSMRQLHKISMEARKPALLSAVNELSHIALSDEQIQEMINILKRRKLVKRRSSTVEDSLK